MWFSSIMVEHQVEFHHVYWKPVFMVVSSEDILGNILSPIVKLWCRRFGAIGVRRFIVLWNVAGLGGFHIQSSLVSQLGARNCGRSFVVVCAIWDALIRATVGEYKGQDQIKTTLSHWLPDASRRGGAIRKQECGYASWKVHTVSYANQSGWKVRTRQ